MKSTHMVTIEWWRQDGQPISASGQERLQQVAWEQVAERLKEGYREGELTRCGGTYRGYWSIETKEAQP